MKSKMKYVAIGITLAGLALGLAGCAGKTAPATTSGLDNPQVLVGKVAETMNGGGYTYILLDQSGKKTWVAIPATKVSVGDEVKLLPGAEMPVFTSKALNRTFEMILFSGGVYKEGAAGAAAAAAPEAKKEAPAAKAGGPVLKGKVVETMDAAGYTYILVEKDGKRGWSAVPTTSVKVGDEVELIPGVDMGSFKSSTLKKTFDEIHFSTGIKGAKTGALPNSKPADADSAAAGAQAMPPGHPKIDAGATAAAPAAPQETISGKVVETTNAGGYTYLCLEKEGKKTWVAIPATDVKVGQELTLPGGSVMTNFTSLSLNRTFEKIIFTSGPQ